MNYLSRKTNAWQSCDCVAKTDSPRTCELKLLRARRVAYYESIGIIKTGSPENANISTLKVFPRVPLGSKTNSSESQTSTSRGHWQSPYSVASEDMNLGQQLPKVIGEKSKEDETKMGQRVQAEGRRNSCPSELDLSLLDDVLVPETQKLRHVMNWAHRFLSKCHGNQELKSPDENPPFTLSLLGQSKTVQDCDQDAFISSCHPPSKSQDDDLRIHTDSQKSFSFSSITTDSLSGTSFSLDHLSSFEERRFPGNQASEWQETIFQKEKRPPMSPLVDSKQPSLVQPTHDRPGNAYSQNQSNPEEKSTLSEIVSVQLQPKDSCEKRLLEKTNEDWLGNDYFWTPLADSSEDECTDENGKKWKTFRKGIQLRDSKEVSGISLSSRSLHTMSARLKGNIFSGWEADVSEKSKEREITIWKPGENSISKFQVDSPQSISDSIVISKRSPNQFDSPIDDFKIRKGESFSRDLDFVVSLRDFNYKNGLLPECVEEADKTFVSQVIRGRQEVCANSEFDVGKSEIHKRDQRQIHESYWGNDSVIQISNLQVNSPGDASENVTSKVCSECTSEGKLTSDHHCVMCHNMKVNLFSSTGIDGKITQTSKLITKEMTCENKEKNIFLSYPVLVDPPETISEDSLSSQGSGDDSHRISWDDALSEKSEQRASVLETYFFYLQQLNKIRGCNSEEQSSSFSNHFTGLLENNTSKGDPEEKDRGEEIRSNGESRMFQAIGCRDTAKPRQENIQHDSVKEETTDKQLFPKSLSNLIKESKLHPEERPFSASIKITSRTTGYKNYWEKSSVAWPSYEHGEQDLRSQNMSRPSSAKTEKRKNTESSDRICPSGSTPKYLCKNVFIDMEREMANKRSKAASALSRWQLLPDEIWIYIFSLLSHKELSLIAQVCRRFCQLASDDSFWKRIHISDCHSLNDDSLITLGRHHPQALTLHRCHDDIEAITDQGLKQFFHHCRESLKIFIKAVCDKSGMLWASKVASRIGDDVTVP
ncbi:uncharacterized protein LOC141496420 [Macrotis lagotis]|uniref:uncharacterized protein LOC141496420 n=1 Tax=Macrotis lagotis TaxID=92651 RepID=UPI003D6998C5